MIYAVCPKCHTFEAIELEEWNNNGVTLTLDCGHFFEYEDN